jgi:hypothetical protein
VGLVVIIAIVVVMYFESILLLVSLGIAIPYGCFSLINSLADQDFERRYGVRPKAPTTTLVNRQKTIGMEQPKFKPAKDLSSRT